VWATEALLAVLTNPDLPPIEPALFDSIVSKLVVRLAKDAADFFSLDNYQGFPKYRSDILARLMEDLPKIAKDPSDINRRRYLGDPMIQGTMPDLAQGRQQQEDIATQKALEILKSRPEWAQSQLALIQAMEDLAKDSDLDPWQRALNYYRAMGEAWLGIVSGNETAQAFVQILSVIEDSVYRQCFEGKTPETIRATSPPMRQFERDLRDGDKDFRKRAAERAIRAAPSEKGPPDAELEKRATARSGWLDQKLMQNPDWSSDVDIAAHGGPTYNTIQRYRSGTKSTQDKYVRKKFARALGCKISEVPE